MRKKKINFEPVIYITAIIVFLMFILSVLELHDKEKIIDNLKEQNSMHYYQVRSLELSLCNYRDANKTYEIKILDLERQIGILKRHKCYEW